MNLPHMLDARPTLFLAGHHQKGRLALPLVVFSHRLPADIELLLPLPAAEELGLTWGAPRYRHRSITVLRPSAGQPGSPQTLNQVANSHGAKSPTRTGQRELARSAGASRIPLLPPGDARERVRPPPLSDPNCLSALEALAQLFAGLGTRDLGSGALRRLQDGDALHVVGHGKDVDLDESRKSPGQRQSVRPLSRVRELGASNERHATQSILALRDRPPAPEPTTRQLRRTRGVGWSEPSSASSGLAFMSGAEHIADMKSGQV